MLPDRIYVEEPCISKDDVCTSPLDKDSSIFKLTFSKSIGFVVTFKCKFSYVCAPRLSETVILTVRFPCGSIDENSLDVCVDEMGRYMLSVNVENKYDIGVSSSNQLVHKKVKRVSKAYPSIGEIAHFPSRGAIFVLILILEVAIDVVEGFEKVDVTLAWNIYETPAESTELASTSERELTDVNTLSLERFIPEFNIDHVTTESV
mmetsp:Transcript_7038/g.10750  ORF Transcript_7038/g.10750 Transcript_7038/m.10750 type:complete len:205 (+) Transcript_7038:1053-1667(+)